MITELQKVELIHAVYNQDLPTIERLLADYSFDFQNGSQSRLDRKIHVLIHFAATNGYLAVVKRFLEKEPKLLDQVDGDGETPLILAVKNEEATVAKYLISENADLEKATTLDAHHLDHDKTALLWAIQNGDVDLVDHLIDAGAKLTTLRGKHPIHFAARLGYPRIVNLLLKNNRQTIDLIDQEGQTPLIWAAKAGHDDIVQLLIEKKANLEQTTTLAPDHPNHGKTALIWAIEGGYATIVQRLINAGAAVTIPNGQHLIELVTQAGHLKIIKLLLEQYPEEPNLITQYGEKLLHLAASLGYTDIVSFLISKQVKLDTDKMDLHQENQLLTPLHRALLNGHHHVIEALIEAGANITLLKDRHPIHIAASYGYPLIVQLFLKHDPELLNRIDDCGRTPLHWAAMYGHDEVVQYLIEQKEINLVALGKNIDPTTDPHDHSALDLALIYQQVEAANLIIRHMLHQQPQSNILDYIQTKNQALEFLALSPEHTNLIMNDPRLNQLIDEDHTKSTVNYYSTALPRRPSFFLQIDPKINQATVYTPEKDIGAGDSGQVRSFKDKDGKRIAVKTSKLSNDHKKRQVQKKFHKREEMLLKTVFDDEHANKCHLFFFKNCGDQYSSRLLMPYIHGESGHNTLFNTQSKHKIVEIILNLITSLHPLHEKIIHGDCKLDNVRISEEDNQLKTTWIDFGASHQVSEKLRFARPNSHIAPECAMPSNGIVAQENQDVYSFGDMLIKILCYHPKGYELAMAYPSIMTFIQKATSTIPSSRPTLESFYKDLRFDYEQVEAAGLKISELSI